MEEPRRKHNFRILWIVVFIQSLVLMFFAGMVVEHYGREKINPESNSQNYEEIMIRVPKTGEELRKQYLRNLAQHSLLFQMMKWDVFKDGSGKIAPINPSKGKR